MDKFKQYINEHTDDIGNDEPSAQVWINLRKQVVKNSKPFPAIFLIRYASAACLLALTFFCIWYFFNRTNPVLVAVKPVNTKKEAKKINPGSPNNEPPRMAANIRPPSMSKRIKEIQNESPEGDGSGAMKDLEMNFTHVINHQRNKINSTPLYASNPSYYNYFIAEFQRIDNDEALLKNEVRKSGLTDGLLTQLINIYQQKLNILKALQVEINKTNTLFKENRPSSENDSHSFLNI